MQRPSLSLLPVSALLLGIAAAGSAATPLWQRASAPEPFDELSFHLESNVTDQDGEVVLHAETGLPIEKIALLSPEGTVVKMLDASGGGIGLSELRLESGEPSIDEVKAAYPEGLYTVRALTLSGQIIMGAVELSHDLPARWDIVAPERDAVLPAEDVTVEWVPDPSADHYTIELEDTDDERRLAATPRAGQSSFVIPGSLLVPGAEYQLVMVAHAPSGNRVVQERYFRTAP